MVETTAMVSSMDPAECSARVCPIRVVPAVLKWSGSDIRSRGSLCSAYRCWPGRGSSMDGFIPPTSINAIRHGSDAACMCLPNEQVSKRTLASKLLTLGTCATSVVHRNGWKRPCPRKRIQAESEVRSRVWKMRPMGITRIPVVRIAD